MTSPHAAHISAASINQTVGDWFGNARRIHDVLADAKSRGVQLVVLPEMCIPGYSLGDRLLMRGTTDRSWRVLEEVALGTQGIVACVGLPIRHHGVLYNAVAVIASQQIVGLVCKEHLATGDVQYEDRWFTPWPRGRAEVFVSPSGQHIPIGNLLFDVQGLGKLAVEVCEDGWKGIRPGSLHALAGAQILVNPSASWFVQGKHARRRRMVQQISAEDFSVYVYTSLLGCDATRLVFDGSVFISQEGEVLAEGRRFNLAADYELVDRVVDLDRLDRARWEEGSWRHQVQRALRGEYGPLPQTVAVTGVATTTVAPAAEPPYWLGPEPLSLDPSLDWLVGEGLFPHLPTAQDLPHLELELALAVGLREYTRKNGIRGITLALSGGRDSSMCAVLVDRMMRYAYPSDSAESHKLRMREFFTTAYLGTDHSGSATRSAARALAEEIGAEHLDGAIQDTVDLHLDVMEQMTGERPSWTNPAHDIPLQNVQARLRSSLIWMVANLRGHLLLATSNKSEVAVGYTTMDGDTSGGLAPIADVPKSLVTLWLRWASEVYGYDSLHQVFATPATAELRPAEDKQSDEDDLMPFAVLDRLIYQFVQRGQDPLEMFHTLWPELSEHYDHQPRAFVAHIDRFVKLFCRAQWKRERFAISFRVTAFDLDPKTGFRFPAVQAPFTEELRELHTWLEHLEEQSEVG